MRNGWLAPPSDKIVCCACGAVQGKRRQLDILFVNSKMIRYVHIPDRINIYKHLNAHVRRLLHNPCLPLLVHVPLV